MHLKESNSACSWSNHECACSWRNYERVYSWRNVEWAYSWKNLDDVILKDLLFKEPLWSMFMMGILMEHALEGNWQLSMMSSPIFLTFQCQSYTPCELGRNIYLPLFVDFVTDPCVREWIVFGKAWVFLKRWIWEVVKKLTPPKSLRRGQHWLGQKYSQQYLMWVTGKHLYKYKR